MPVVKTAVETPLAKDDELACLFPRRQPIIIQSTANANQPVRPVDNTPPLPVVTPRPVIPDPALLEKIAMQDKQLADLQKQLTDLLQAKPVPPKDGGLTGEQLAPLVLMIERQGQEMVKLQKQLTDLLLAKTAPPVVVEPPVKDNKDDLILYYTSHDSSWKELDQTVDSLRKQGWPVVVTKLLPQDAAVNGVPLIYQPFKGKRVSGTSNCSAYIASLSK